MVQGMSSSCHLGEVERLVEPDNDDVDLAVSMNTVSMNTQPASCLNGLDDSLASTHERTLAGSDEAPRRHRRRDDGPCGVNADVSELLFCLCDRQRREVRDEQDRFAGLLQPVDRFWRAGYWLVCEPDNTIEIE